MSRDSREEKHCSWLLSCSVARLLKGQLDPATEQPRNPATLNCTIAGLMKGSSRHAVLAGFLGWTLDAFDFFVVVFLYDTLAKEFSVSKALIIATVGVTLAFRP